MIVDRIWQTITIAFIAAAIGGCSASAPSRFYMLTPTAAGTGATPLHATVIVGPVSVPATVDQPQLVVQVASNRVELEEFDRWAAPLDDSIARTVAGNLAALLGTPDVTTAPLANFNPDYWVTINIQRFELVRGQSVLVEAVWAVRSIASNQTRSGRTIAREAVEGEGFDALVSADSIAIAQVSTDIANAITGIADHEHKAISRTEESRAEARLLH